MTAGELRARPEGPVTCEQVRPAKACGRPPARVHESRRRQRDAGLRPQCKLRQRSRALSRVPSLTPTPVTGRLSRATGSRACGDRLVGSSLPANVTFVFRRSDRPDGAASRIRRGRGFRPRGWLLRQRSTGALSRRCEPARIGPAATPDLLRVKRLSRRRRTRDRLFAVVSRPVEPTFQPAQMEQYSPGADKCPPPDRPRAERFGADVT